MLIITKANLYEQIKEDVDEGVVYNLSSLKEGYERLNVLPQGNIIEGSEKEFDILYSDYIMNNDLIFLNMFKVIYSLYEGKTVFLLVADDEEMEDITESFTKFIQQRYGYDAVYLYDAIDLDDFFCKKQESSFSINGVYNLDNDKERYTELLVSNDLKNK